MASMKFSTVATDIHEPRKPYHYFVNLGYVQIIGVCNVTSFSKFRVSRLSSSAEPVELSEPVEEILVRKQKPYGKKRIGRNLWKRFQKNDKEQEPPFVYNGNIGVEDVIASVTQDTSVEQCSIIMKLLDSSNDNDRTLRFFEWMRNNGKLKENLTVYNLALRALARKGNWEVAETLLQELTATSSGFDINFQVFNTLIYACYKQGLAELGTKWFQLMLEKGVQPNIATYGMIMSLYQKGSNVTEAEFAFHQMRSSKLQCTSAYSAMITIYTRLGLYEKSVETITLMEEDKVLPNLENWLVRLNVYSQQGKLDEAERVVLLMQEAGISPNIVTYNTLITGYGKVSNMDAAESILKNLKTVGLEPDETTYRSMVEGWGRADNYKEAMCYYKKLKRSGFEPNSSNFYTMINLQARHKDEEGVLVTIEDMRKMGCQYSSILSSLLQAYERVGRVDKVPLVLKGSFYEHVLVDQTSCSIVVMSYIKHYLVDDVLKVLADKRWKDIIFQDNLYHLLICSCKEYDHQEDAIKIYTYMPKSDTNLNLHITCTMIDIYSAIGRFTEAENFYLKLKSLGIALDMIAYSIVVRMYVKSGSLKDACLVLETMEKEKRIVPDTFLLRDMLRIYQQCDMKEKLQELYYRMSKSKMNWDQEMYNCVINCCARALPVDELSQIFDEMLHRGFSPNTITVNVLIDVYGKARLFKKARKVLWMARKWGLTDVISYNTIIAAYGQSKNFTNMRSTVRKMEFNGFSVSLEAYNCMLDAYGKEGQIERFRSVVQRMKESGVVSDRYTYNILINIYGDQGWIDEVFVVLRELKECGLGPNLYSYNTLIKAYGIAGMVEEAVDVLKEMREKGFEPDRVTFLNLIRALQRNDNFLEAVKWSLWMKQMGMSSSKR
ncbi:hypothetical protein GIB67_016847 [Kingdonia uniflora]|uniref:Pentatricopeptide repeat-containing protein n=1 Tax=Kingdonia uniflora TaxID=39325 RepID=A0A7J7LQ51_9MAGN|nr:hypothetical protein GIB67_016847 [Kingdonia uniflora]